MKQQIQPWIIAIGCAVIGICATAGAVLAHALNH